MAQNDAALMAEVDTLPAEARVRAQAVMDLAAGWAGRLQAVEVDQDVGGRLHITLHFQNGAWDFFTTTPRQLASN